MPQRRGRELPRGLHAPARPGLHAHRRRPADRQAALPRRVRQGVRPDPHRDARVARHAGARGRAVQGRRSALRLPVARDRAAQQRVLRAHARRPAGLGDVRRDRRVHAPLDPLRRAAVPAHALRQPPGRRAQPVRGAARGLGVQPVPGPERQEGRVLGPARHRRARGLAHRARVERPRDHAVRERDRDHARGRLGRRQVRDVPGDPARGRRPHPGRHERRARRAVSHHPRRDVVAGPRHRRHDAVPPVDPEGQRAAVGGRRRGRLVRARRQPHELRRGPGVRAGRHRAAGAAAVPVDRRHGRRDRGRGSTPWTPTASGAPTRAS